MKMFFQTAIARSSFRAGGCVALALLFSLHGASASIGGLSDNVVQQITALEAEKDGRTPAQQKMASQVIYAIRFARDGFIVPGVTNLRSAKLDTDASGRVKLDIRATVTTNL